MTLLCLFSFHFALQVSFHTRFDRQLTNPESNPWFDPAMVGGGGGSGKVRDLHEWKGQGDLLVCLLYLFATISFVCLFI